MTETGTERGVSMKRKRFQKYALCAAAVFLGGMAARSVMTAAQKTAAVKIYPGDLTLDSAVDIKDGVMLARVCAEDTSLEITDKSKLNADVDRNGTVSFHDLTHLLRQLAGFLPMPQPIKYPEETTAETTAATTTLTETTVTTTETTVTDETSTTPGQSGSSDLTVDSRAYPLDVSMSVLTGAKEPNEMLTVQYQSCNMTFAVYSDDPANTLIAISANDLLIGYYAFGSTYTAPEGYQIVEYIDKQTEGEGTLYAVLVIKNGYSIRFNYVADKNNFSVLSKLNYYGVNGIRAINGLPPYQWDEELAKVALAHSREMADHDFFEHNSLDGSKFSARLTNAGIDWSGCAENIDCGYTDPFAALNGWYNSESGHRKNLLNPGFEYIGVGFAYNADSHYGYYGTQDFYKGW